MGFIENLTNIFRSPKKPQQEQRDISQADALLFNSINLSRDNLIKLSAVYRCIDLISNTIAQMPCKTYFVDSQGDKKLATNHTAYNVLFREANALMSANQFTKQLIYSALVYGNGYAKIRRNGNGDCVSLQWIPSELVTTQLSQDLTTVTYSVSGMGNIESVNMIHLTSGFCPDGLVGVSPLRACRDVFENSLAADKQAKNYYSNGCNVGGILTVAGMLTDEKKLQNKLKWSETFQGNNGGGICILDGNMTFQPIQTDAVRAQLLEVRQFNISEIARVFGVPLSKLGDLSGASQYGTLEESNNQFLTDCIQPWLARIEAEYERKIFKPSERGYIDVIFDTSVILRTSLSSQADTFTKLFQIGAITQNEIRKQLNLSAVEGGDKTMTMIQMQTTGEMGDKINDKEEDE